MRAISIWPWRFAMSAAEEVDLWCTTHERWAIGSERHAAGPEHVLEWRERPREGTQLASIGQVG